MRDNNAQTALPPPPVSLVGYTLGYSRLILTLLIVLSNVAQSAPLPLSRHQPGMINVVRTVPRKDTGGERRSSHPR